MTNYLISASELGQLLDQPRVRIFDTAVYLRPEGHGYSITSGYDSYLSGHIPGAGFIDLVEDWADTDSALRFTLPEMGKLQAAVGASGISADDHVILYSSGHLMWATRAWWLLHHAGHKNISILNGSLSAWQAAGGDTKTGGHSYAPCEFAAATTASAFATTADVEAGMDGKICTINSLSQALYEGTGDFYYQRRGHIPGSLLLSYEDLLKDDFFLPHDELSDKLGKRGMLSADQVITYCGGGIAATIDAFACLLCGQENVRVYDGSMSEWVSDENRPLTVGAEP